MTLIVEDGTGLSTAQAFCDVAYASAYADARGMTFSTGTTTQKEKALILGGDWLANELRLRYVGSRKTSTQRLPWPRTSAVENYGLAIEDTTIPWRLKDANAELAVLVHAGVSLQADLDNGGLLVSSKTIDVLSTSWFQPEKFQILSAVPGEAIRLTVMGFLAPLLRNLGPVRAEPITYAPVDATPFVAGEYDA